MDFLAMAAVARHRSTINAVAIIVLLWSSACINTVLGQCDGLVATLTAYPNGYKTLIYNSPVTGASDSSCVWAIDALSPERVVTVQVINISLPGYSPCPRTNSLILNDGRNESKELARLCGQSSKTVSTYKSSGRFMLVRIDFNLTSSTLFNYGLQLNYSAVSLDGTVSGKGGNPPALAVGAAVILGSLFAIVAISIIIGCVCKYKDWGNRCFVFSLRRNQSIAEGMDNPAVEVEDFRGSLPPNYSQLSFRTQSRSAQETEDATGRRGSGGGGGREISRQGSTVSSRPPPYTNSMLEKFPPGPNRRILFLNLRGVRKTWSNSSIAPPSTGTPPPPLTPDPANPEDESGNVRFTLDPL